VLSWSCSLFASQHAWLCAIGFFSSFFFGPTSQITGGKKQARNLATLLAVRVIGIVNLLLLFSLFRLHLNFFARAVVGAEVLGVKALTIENAL